MSELTSRTETGVGDTGSDLRVTHAETAIDDVLGALTDERRRAVLMAICERPGATDVSALAERVADRLTPERSGTASDGTVHRLRVSLVHQHLPKLYAAGLVEYDIENQRVEATDAIAI
jgi:DNA-binding transcriptional ArsR family regulator